MGFLALFKSTYDVDTLDTRFTTSSSVPYTVTLEAKRNGKTNKDLPGRSDVKTSPSRWHTVEFYFYYFVIALSVFCMLYYPYQVSQSTDPRYYKYRQILSPGWIAGREIDNTDSQYRTFRENLPYMGLLIVFHPLLRKFVTGALTSSTTSGSSKLEQGDARLNARASFDFAFAIIYLLALHGVSAIKVLSILWLNYKVATTFPRQRIPFATWAFNIGILFANDIFSGYRFKNMAMFMSGSASIADNSMVSWGAWIDSWGGLMARWEILFNLTVLRLISFNLDYYWSLGQRNTSPLEKKQLDPANLSERDRINIPAQHADYNFRNYMAYAIYAPLYLTGPILTYNDYIAQLRYPPATIERTRTIKYAVRWVLCLLTLEFVLHTNWVGAISKGYPDWSSYTSAQLCMLSFVNLHIIWLKLLLPWRLFRLWALVDGVDPPENMLRCVNDNFSPIRFWRGWHRSFNRWIVRYLFVPLGGANFRTWVSSVRSTMTYLLVFTFVALWHDIQLRLLIWGWLIVLFLIPEVVAGVLFPARIWEGHPTVYRMLCGVGAVLNILMMVSANLVGFATGLEGLNTIIHAIVHEWSGLMFLLSACAALFVGVQVMFEVREAEARRGISLRC